MRSAYRTHRHGVVLPRALAGLLFLLVVLALLPALLPAQETAQAPQLTAYEQELARAAARLPAGAAPAVRANLALAQLALKKARLAGQGGLWFGGEALSDRLLASGRAALSRLAANEPVSPEPGQLNELAYFTANDGTVQPYYLYLPRDYTPAKKWPLIVFLHGYVPSISVLDPWVLPPEVCDVAGANGCLLLIPYGRRNTDFQGVGEVDVLASLQEVRTLFPVDPDRLYLSGCSMGGMGVWNTALRHPGLFAAATPMCGHTDMFRWWGWDRADVPAWKRWLVEWDNAVDQALNVSNQHIFAQHGELDNLVPAEQSRLMVKAAQQAGTPIKYYEWPGESHFIYLQKAPYEKAWSWQTQFALDRSPKTIEFLCFSLEYNTSFWFTIDAFERWGETAEVRATADPETGTLKLVTRNVAAWHLATGPAGFAGRQTIAVDWNGKQTSATVADGRLALPAPGPTAAALPFPPAKRHGLCGPCEEVFDTRFVVVQGTAGTAEEDQDLARKVARWAKEWDDFADGPPLVKTDVEVTPEDVQTANLVCFGTPQTNTVLARVADRLPLTIGDHRYVIQGREYKGADLGLVMCYPNPLARDGHYVLIYAGEYYGQQLSINHKHDLLPDFLVFTTQSFGRDQTNDALCAGYFGMDWKLDDRLLWHR